MYITALTHRDALFDLTLRWLNDDFDPRDPRTVSRIFLYATICYENTSLQRRPRCPRSLQT